MRTVRLLRVYMLLLWAITQATTWAVFYRHHTTRGVGDWLISYQAGWTRRGLLGEGLLALARGLGVNPGLLVWLLWGLLYALFLGALYLLLREQNLKPYVWLLASPFALAFPLHSLLKGAPVRKEWLYLTLLAWLVLAARRLPRRKFRAGFAAALVLLVLSGLAHEMLLLFLPYVWVVGVWRLEPAVLQRWAGWSLLLAGAVGLAVVLPGPLSPAQVQRLYAAVEQAGYTLAQREPHDPFTVLTWDIRDAWAFSQDFWQARGGWLVALGRCLATVGLMAWAYIPLWPRLRAVWHRARWWRWTLGASVVGTLALMPVAIDWGRFVTTHALSWFILTLLPGLPPGREPWPLPRSRPWHWLLLAAYALAWRVDFYCLESGNFFSRLLAFWLVHLAR